MTGRVLVGAHAGPAADRARRLYGGSDAEVVELAGIGSALRLAARLIRHRPPPGVAVLVDVADDTTIAAVAARLRGVPVVVDTGDLVYELERSRGARSRGALALVWAGERAALGAARHVVVRGREHVSLLRRPATVIPDLAPVNARPMPGDAVRRELELDGFVIGLVGSLNLAPRLGIVYGWDVVEALAHTDPQVQALVVGDGPGRSVLERRARELGVEHRCRFIGVVPPERVAEWVAAMDVAVSTQTNDRVGAVRTTGKLPLYLACGVPVLASDVGEARHLLGPLGWTIPYDGVVDAQYPLRLAACIEQLRTDPEEHARRRAFALELHRTHFDEKLLVARARSVVASVMDGT